MATSLASGQRVCQVCSGPLPTDPRRKVCSDECRAEAARIRARAWYAANGDRPEVKQRVAEASRRNYEAMRSDPELLARQLAATARWRAANSERMATQYREWRNANRERVRAKNQRRRARLLNAFVEDVDLLILAERDDLLCGICYEPVDMDIPWPDRRSATVDHIVPLAAGGEHSYANTQLAHHACNARKNDRVPDHCPAPGAGTRPRQRSMPDLADELRRNTR
jgi:5-methylcytosine-specific restriction endonuclease McrA